tara:strand:+ start:1898 stop:2410 length:513 start_codon:yes stop_codon:yes gene_type:complete
MMTKEQKKNYVEEMKKVFSSNEAVMVAHYQGLSVKELDKIRAEMRKSGIFFKITKNKITKLALKETKYKDLEKFFNGPTAAAISSDPIMSAKILAKYAKTSSSLKIVAGFMDGKVLEADDVAKIATLPTLDEARAKIVGILSAPAQKFLSILLAPGSKIAILAHAKSKKG